MAITKMTVKREDYERLCAECWIAAMAAGISKDEIRIDHAAVDADRVLQEFKKRFGEY